MNQQNYQIKSINNTKNKPTFDCCLCGKTFIGYGNNPEPLESQLKDCCDNCNQTKVTPEKKVP